MELSIRLVMLRATGRACKARPPDLFLLGPARPKPDPQSPKARRAFSGLKSANFWPISGWIRVKLRNFLLKKVFNFFLAGKARKKPGPRPEIVRPGPPEAWYEKARPARGPKWSGPARPKPENFRPVTSLITGVGFWNGNNRGFFSINLLTGLVFSYSNRHFLAPFLW